MTDWDKFIYDCVVSLLAAYGLARLATDFFLGGGDGGTPLAEKVREE